MDGLSCQAAVSDLYGIFQSQSAVLFHIDRIIVPFLCKPSVFCIPVIISLLFDQMQSGINRKSISGNINIFFRNV